MWIVWLERNCRSFEDKEKTLEELKILCQCSLMEWSRCWGFTECSSLSEFMPSLSLVSWQLSCCCVVLCYVAIVLLLCWCSSSWTSCNSHFFSLFNISFLITYQKKKMDGSLNDWLMIAWEPEILWETHHLQLKTSSNDSLPTTKDSKERLERNWRTYKLELLE